MCQRIRAVRLVTVAVARQVKRIHRSLRRECGQRVSPRDVAASSRSVAKHRGGPSIGGVNVNVLAVSAALPPRRLVVTGAFTTHAS